MKSPEVMILLAFLVGSGCLAQAENLVRNAGFEEVLAPAWHKRTPEDAKRRIHRTSDQARSGESCVVLENLETAYTRLRQGADQSIHIAPGSLVELSAWVKSELSADGRIIVQLFCMGAGDAILGSPAVRPKAERDGWHQFHGFIRIPDGMVYCMPYLQIRDGVGKVYFDDVHLRVTRPPPAPPARPRVALLSDLAEDDSTLREMQTLLGNGLVSMVSAADEERLRDCVGLVVLMRASPLPDWVRKALVSAVERELPVFMDIRSFAAWQELGTVAVDCGVRTNDATWEFAGEGGVFEVTVVCVDERDGAGRIALLHNEVRLDSWQLDQTPADGRDTPVQRTRQALALSPGDRLALRLIPDRGESCRVDALELRAADGTVTRVEAEDLTLGRNLTVESPALMFPKGIKARGSPSAEQQMACGLRVVVDSEVTSGFSRGEIVPRSGTGSALVVLAGSADVEGLQTLAVGPGDGPGLVRLGNVVAADVLSLGEPSVRNVGAYYKYLFLTNTMLSRVRYGELYLKRYRYEEFVELMKQTAERHSAIRFEDEGAACGDYRMYSLNLGAPGAPLYFMYGACHGSEWEPGYGLLTFARRLAQGRLDDVVDLRRVSIKIMPILNPSGYDAFSRKNAHGVDLNRQGDCGWDVFRGTPRKKGGEYGPDSQQWKGAAPFAEPEAQVYRRICSDDRLFAVLDFHGNTSATNNKVGVLPTTARADNELRAFDLQDAVNRVLRGRFVLRQSDEDAPSPYLLGRVYVGGPVPFLMNTSMAGRYGILVELTAGYRSSYGTVLQTDVTCEICRAFLEAYALDGGKAAPTK